MGPAGGLANLGPHKLKALHGGGHGLGVAVVPAHHLADTAKPNVLPGRAGGEGNQELNGLADLNLRIRSEQYAAGAKVARFTGDIHALRSVADEFEGKTQVKALVLTLIFQGHNFNVRSVGERVNRKQYDLAKVSTRVKYWGVEKAQTRV